MVNSYLKSFKIMNINPQITKMKERNKKKRRSKITKMKNKSQLKSLFEYFFLFVKGNKKKNNKF